MAEAERALGAIDALADGAAAALARAGKGGGGEPTRRLALRYGERRVRAGCISPGFTATA